MDAFKGNGGTPLQQTMETPLAASNDLATISGTSGIFRATSRRQVMRSPGRKAEGGLATEGRMFHGVLPHCAPLIFSCLLGVTHCAFLALPRLKNILLLFAVCGFMLHYR